MFGEEVVLGLMLFKGLRVKGLWVIGDIRFIAFGESYSDVRFSGGVSVLCE